MAEDSFEEFMRLAEALRRREERWDEIAKDLIKQGKYRKLVVYEMVNCEKDGELVDLYIDCMHCMFFRVIDNSYCCTWDKDEASRLDAEGRHDIYGSQQMRL